jgi:putative tryptophan/tyrosine transport system substrate-binding protein
MLAPRPLTAVLGRPEYYGDDRAISPLQASLHSMSRLLGIFRMWSRIVTVVTVLPLVPLAAEAQAPSKVGYLSIGPASDPRRVALFGAFRQGLRDMGYVEGKNIVIESRFGDGKPDQLPRLAAELVGLKVAVIVTSGTPATQAAQSVTKSIPIVMSGVVDPLRTGLVASLGQPGGNVTGLSLMAPELIGKQMQLLKELVPNVSRVAVLWNPANASSVPQLREAEVAAPALGLRLQPLEARGPDDVDLAFAAMARERAGGLIVLVDGVLIEHRTRITRLAERARIPAVYGTRELAEVGGLLFYGASPADQNRRAGTYVDKILKGAKPANLPVEQPTKFELFVNLKAAKALGLAVPQSLLVRADQVMQ